MDRLTLRWRRLRHDEDGIALVSVVAGMMIASLFAFAALGYALNTQKASKGNQDWNSALAAAQAGIDDYIGYLNRNDNYARSVDCSNTALKGPKNPASNTCGWTTSTAAGWKPVVSTEPAGPAFHYDVDPAKLESEGIVLVTSTGRAGNETRSLQVGVGRGGSTDFLYYTDHEDGDPDNVQACPSGMDSRCGQYWWQLSSGRPGSWNCTEITFIGGDVLDGPVHTNDTPLMSLNGSGVRPKFLEGLSTSEPDCKNAVRGNSSTYKLCDRTQLRGDYGTSYPRYQDPLYLPDNSSQFATYPGCQYKGSTRIKFRADGTMQVWSAESTSASTTAACGGAAPNGAVVNVPNDEVIYVATGSSGAHQCKSGEIGDGLPLGNYTGSNTANYTYELRMLDQAHYCGQGNVYIEGVLKGRVTVAAQNMITATGDLVLARGLSGTDMLGLVASNSVEVYNPWTDTRQCSNWSGTPRRCTGTWSWAGSETQVSGWPKRYADVDQGTNYPSNGIQIAAAIQTLQHSFGVQNYFRGSGEGQLYVRGAIAQEWRGIVGRGSAGYLKDYRYDKRLKFSAPPYFPQWTNAVWGGRYTGEVTAQYGP